MVNNNLFFYSGVQLTTMLKFKRLAQISSDPRTIADSLKHSKLMQVSEDGSKIRRNPEIPLPENSLEYWQVVKRRTVYIVSCFTFFFTANRYDHNGNELFIFIFLMSCFVVRDGKNYSFWLEGLFFITRNILSHFILLL